MPIVAEQCCPYCKRKIVIEKLISETLPFGIVRLHKFEDYQRRIKRKNG